MGVQKPQVPPEIRTALALGLKNLVKTSDPVFELLMNSPAGLHEEQQLFTIGLSDLKGDARLGNSNSPVGA